MSIRGLWSDSMKKTVLLILITLFWSVTLFAAGTQYNLRVDAFSCPFCAYGIEKKLVRTEGVESVVFDLEKGLVIVKVEEGVILTEEQLQVFDFSGKFLRVIGKQEKEVNQLSRPMNLTVANDKLYVADYVNHQIQKW